MAQHLSIYGRNFIPNSMFQVLCCVRTVLYTAFPFKYPHRKGGRNSPVGIATRHELDGPVIEFRWGRDFPHPLRPARGSTQPPVQWVPGLSRG